MKEIELTQGKFALVDDGDYEFLNQFKWSAAFSANGNCFYAVRHSPRINGKRKTISMHRVIMELTDAKIQIDHKDHDTLNNCRSNLRIATSAQNMANRRADKNSSSRYLGVSWDNNRNKWRASIKKMHISYFNNETDAALAYNKKASELFGEFANLNLITSSKHLEPCPVAVQES